MGLDPLPSVDGYYSYGSLLTFLFIRICFLICAGTTEGNRWCDRDTGPTSVIGLSGEEHMVHSSVTRDGSVWLRMGVEHMSYDWTYRREFRHKLTATILQPSLIDLLQHLNYTDFCILTDINFSMQVSGGWHPSFLVTFNPRTKETDIIRFKHLRNCNMKTNVTFTIDKQGITCNGAGTNSCGLKNLPRSGHKTDPLFIKVAQMDPRGQDSWLCLPSQHRNTYTFSGSYYHAYVKMASCPVPTESLKLGYEPKLRANRDDNANAVYILDPTQTALSNGYIIAWEIFAKVISIQHSIFFQVWRPLARDQNKFTLVGQTHFQPLRLRYQEKALSRNEYVRIRRGDVLGIYFPKYNPIAWSAVPCASATQRFRLMQEPVEVAMGQTYRFQVASAHVQPCRQYSLSAKFDNKVSAKLIEDWKCPTGIIPSDTRKRSKNDGKGDTIKGQDGDGEGESATDGPGFVPEGRTDSSPSHSLPMYVILLIVGGMILLLVIVGGVSYYRAIKS